MEPHKVVMSKQNWNDLHFLEISSTTARLRTHAQRALREAGYKTPDGKSRRAHAEALRSMAKRIEEQRKLGLSTKWWVELATKTLDLCDKENPT